jgi:ankyrin repeat protein
MLKRDIKRIFTAIRDGDIGLIDCLVTENPDVINVRNFAPPKKDDGQSPLQVAFKTGHFDIADFLISRGADVNFVESSSLNEWTAPVIHDCIRAVAFNSYTLKKNEKSFGRAMTSLHKLIENGASVTSEDSYGNNCLIRAILDARQMINHPNAELGNGIVLRQFRELFSVLLAAGALLDEKSERRPSAREAINSFNLAQYELL